MRSVRMSFRFWLLCGVSAGASLFSQYSSAGETAPKSANNPPVPVANALPAPGFDVDPALPAGARPAADIPRQDQAAVQEEVIEPDEKKQEEEDEKQRIKEGRGKYSLDPKHDKAFEAASRVNHKYARDLIKRKGINGSAIGFTKAGKPGIILFLTGSDNPVIPEQLDGIPVSTKRVGPIYAHANPKARFSRPIPIGVSAAPIQSICYSGTLGCRVFKKGDRTTVYALSNNHVFSNEGVAAIGTTITQPSPGDNLCSTSEANRIGALAEFVPINFDFEDNTVDAAIARIDTGLLGNATPDDGYGEVKGTIQKAFIGMGVMKYGRTSGFTRGVVTEIDSFNFISYEQGFAIFVDQIAYEPVFPYTTMSSPGDSGSLVVSTAERRPVALNFAGSFFFNTGFGNPIKQVTRQLGIFFEGEPNNKRGRPINARDSEELSNNFSFSGRSKRVGSGGAPGGVKGKLLRRVP